eukprot:1118023-Rhodomonas_salina.2
MPGSLRTPQRKRRRGALQIKTHAGASLSSLAPQDRQEHTLHRPITAVASEHHSHREHARTGGPERRGFSGACRGGRPFWRRGRGRR